MDKVIFKTTLPADDLIDTLQRLRHAMNCPSYFTNQDRDSITEAADRMILEAIWGRFK
ncbi:MAG TPA: hypothetical protein VN081_03805 [Dongiaceae bacterium]|nr:hypothetical protein [Dongiaceae bacterium]